MQLQDRIRLPSLQLPQAPQLDHICAGTVGGGVVTTTTGSQSIDSSRVPWQYWEYGTRQLANRVLFWLTHSPQDDQLDQIRIVGAGTAQLTRSFKYFPLSQADGVLTQVHVLTFTPLLHLP